MHRSLVHRSLILAAVIAAVAALCGSPVAPAQGAAQRGTVCVGEEGGDEARVAGDGTDGSGDEDAGGEEEGSDDEEGSDEEGSDDEEGPDDEETGGDEEGSDDEGEEDEGAPPKFSARFYAQRLTLDASLDGLEGRALPMSIEEVCGVRKGLAKEAAQLAGADGVALLGPRTQIWQGGTRLQGKQGTSAVGGADTATLRVRLKRPRTWREDEDGNPVATFRTRRIDVTD